MKPGERAREWLRHNDWPRIVTASLSEEHRSIMIRMDEKLDRLADLILKGRRGNRQQLIALAAANGTEGITPPRSKAVRSATSRMS